MRVSNTYFRAISGQLPFTSACQARRPSAVAGSTAGYRRMEFGDGFGRLCLVPHGEGENAVALERLHVMNHRLARIGVFLEDGEAAGIRQSRRIRQAEIDDVERVTNAGHIEAAVIV